MEVTAVSSGSQVRAPPPFECRPGSGPDNYSGYWNTNTGAEIKNTPYSNTAGRIDVEGAWRVARTAVVPTNLSELAKIEPFLFLGFDARLLLLGTRGFAHARCL